MIDAVPSQTGKKDTPPASVFLSYSHDDIAFVERLHAGLEANGIAAHLDREDIEKGEAWWDRLQQLISIVRINALFLG